MGPWTLSHLALLPGAGRLHVDGGWAHPRPVAANDRITIKTRTTRGDSNDAGILRLSAFTLNARSTAAAGHRPSDASPCDCLGPASDCRPAAPFRHKAGRVRSC